MRSWSRFGFLALSLCLLSSVAAAGNFSFTGTFVQDDDMQLFLFTAPSTNVMLRTWGYAGGINANGVGILPGGFDPVLSVFDATGGLLPTSPFVGSNNDGAGVATDPATLGALDSLLVLTALTPGNTYVLVLTQNDNASSGPTFGDGFSHAGQGNFTAGEFACLTAAPFCDPTGAQRDGHWAVDITGVGSASVFPTTTATPEPASTLLLMTGIASMALLRRRGKRA
jgi:hypothetical protein